jgi:hypothetical protein
MRSLVITAAIIIFNIVITVLATVAPMMDVDSPTNVTLNQSTLTGFNEQGQIITGTDSQNKYYDKTISITDMLWNMSAGVVNIGGRLTQFGMDSGLALAITTILDMLILLDLLVYWRGINW